MGLEVAKYKIEALCAMECYKHDNCSKYAHSETEKQCILMTPHDFNFLAEEPIEIPNNFNFKVNIGP